MHRLALVSQFSEEFEAAIQSRAEHACHGAHRRVIISMALLRLSSSMPLECKWVLCAYYSWRELETVVTKVA